MAFIVLGTLGFLIIHLFDFVSLKKAPLLKPVTWLVGSGLLVYSIVMVCLMSERLPLPVWSIWLGWLLLLGSLILLIYSLFVNLPFIKTYVARGVGDRLVKTGLYALVRHPWVHCFTLLMLSLFLVSGSSLLLIAAPVWILLDIIMVVIQDKFVFVRMFPGYEEYQQETPMLVPNRRSIAVFVNQSRQDKTNNQKQRRLDKMSTLGELLKQGRTEEMWDRCCGFIDLSLEDFMRIQRRLLLEQLELLKKCELGQRIMNGARPESVEEFRELVPLTTYADYAPYLLKRRLGVLPEKPLTWMHTSGRSGEYPFKRVPLTSRQYREMGPAMLSSLIFSSCRGRGDITLREHDKYLYALAPTPYLSGVAGRRVDEEGLLDFLPTLDEGEKMEFADSVKQGFKLALFEGMDVCGAIASLLLSMGERFSQGSGSINIKPFLRKPKALLRLVKGYMKSKLARRPMLPKDIWSLKGMVAGGTDTTIFRDKIKEMWGRYPLNVYAFTEAVFIATQTWDYQGMTFLPHLNFLEFIPEEDSLKLREDPTHEPKTLLLDEVRAGENYELVITSFLGGTMVRYRNGDMVRITSLRNEQLNIDIPQMEFHSRVDDLIDIAGFTRLTERTIWQAIEHSGVACKDWTARKEAKEQQKLHIYLELKEDGYQREKEVTLAIHQQLKELDSDYANLESFLGLRALEVTLLPENAFQAYRLEQQAAGAKLARLKVPHINPSDSMLDFLINGSRKVAVPDHRERRPASV